MANTVNKENSLNTGGNSSNQELSPVAPTGLRVIYGDSTLGVAGSGFHYIFSYIKGGLESLCKNGKEWMYRTPRPTFWRATTCNDRGNGFSQKAAMWLGADLFTKHIGGMVKIDGEEITLPMQPNNNHFSNEEYADTVEITFIFETCTVPTTTVDVTYLVEKDGKIKVTMNYHGHKDLPQLPVLGLRFIMPTFAIGFEYEGLSGETYPDRMAGAAPGIYRVKGLPVTPYMIPQECGVHMDTKWVEITRNTTLSNADESNEDFSLRFEKLDKNFAFSCLPYTATELENATHHEELPPKRRTVLLMLAKVRGVGGIQSWGADVEEEYHIKGSEDVTFSFMIR
jgi:beta-galactosidase